MKHIVGLSGGIDSQAALTWVLTRFPKEDVIALNSNPGGNEHPLTTQHIAWLSENVHPIVIVHPIWADALQKPETIAKYGHLPNDPLTFDDLAFVRRRFPSSQAQFCTEHLKLRPSLRWIRANVPGEYDRYTGIRRDESHRRNDTPDREYDTWFECQVIHPVATWTKQQCFDYCHGQRVNPLYSLGFDRIGCNPCINWSRAMIRNWARRAPEAVGKVRQWEDRVGRTFFPPTVPGLEFNTIEEVVEWANCERGGKQYSLEVCYTPPVCESKFGLCE